MQQLDMNTQQWRKKARTVATDILVVLAVMLVDYLLNKYL